MTGKKMLDEFLKSATTHKQCSQAFSGWHKGISHYGFWAVEIIDPDWLYLIRNAQIYLQDYAYPNYLRAPHITLTACGLMDEAYFSKSHLAEQVSTLQQLDIPSFEISLGQLNSFTTAMYFSINDPSHSLSKIRTHLNDIAVDNPSEFYHPHITLGMYRDNFKTHQVVNKIRNFKQKAQLTIKVTDLVFCSYETNTLQGPFNIMRRIKLKCSV